MATRWRVVGVNDPGKAPSTIIRGERRWESPLMYRRIDARRHLWEIIEAIDTGSDGTITHLFGPSSGESHEIRRVEITRDFRAWVERVDTNAESDDDR